MCAWKHAGMDAMCSEQPKVKLTEYATDREVVIGKNITWRLRRPERKLGIAEEQPEQINGEQCVSAQALAVWVEHAHCYRRKCVYQRVSHLENRRQHWREEL